MSFSRNCHAISSLLVLVLALPTAACGVASAKTAVTPSTPASPGVPRMEDAMPAEGAPGSTSPPSSSRRSEAPSAPGLPPSAPSALEPAATDDPELSRAKQMVDVEAHLRIEVEGVATAAARLRELATQVGGRIATETTTLDAVGTAQAEFTLRVPGGKADEIFRSLDALGVTRARSVAARDVGKDYYDAVLRLRNLSVTRDRLEEVLKHAVELKDILTVESELSRVRGEIEQIEGQLRYFRDRAAYATIFVTLFVRPATALEMPVIVRPEAKFFPALRGGYLLDIGSEGSSAGYWGAGLAIGFSRQLDLRLDGFRRPSHGDGTLDAFTATVGGRFYSEYLGGGARRFLDPYLGLRGGYARFETRSEAVGGVTVGLELWKTEIVRLDLGIDGLVLFGTGAGAHAAIAPALSVDIAF